ncbi:MAG: hypothetical protein H7Y88_10450 [Phycisphaerales bacterium]|nr:hypothetical protein [Phycisphaerales bacterium]
MDTLLLLVAIGVTVFTVGLMGIEFLSRRLDLLSLRALFLLGFIQFYGLATIFMVWLGTASDLYVATDYGYARLALCMPVFLGLFLAFDRFGARMRWVRKIIPPLNFPATTPGILISTGALLFMATISLVIGYGGYWAAVLIQIRSGIAAGAVGLATFFLLAKRFNPFAWLVFGSVFLTAALLSVAQGSDRRYLLSVLLVVPWMWYFYRLRYKSTSAAVTRLSVVAVAALLVIAAYTGVRHDLGGDRDVTVTARANQFMKLAQKGTIKRGSWARMFYQDTPTNTCFIIENYPQQYKLVPFNGLLFTLTNPIPRSIFPAKPEGLGEVLQVQMNTTANLGVGIIGHGWAEGMFFGVVGYGIVFGLLAGAMDRLIRDRVHNPYFMAAIGSGLGNVIALPRGETSLFMVFIISSFVCITIILYCTRFFLGPFMRATAPISAFPPGIADNPEDDGDLDPVEPPNPEFPDDIWEAEESRQPALALAYRDSASGDGSLRTNGSSNGSANRVPGSLPDPAQPGGARPARAGLGASPSFTPRSAE